MEKNDEKPDPQDWCQILNIWEFFFHRKRCLAIAPQLKVSGTFETSHTDSSRRGIHFNLHELIETFEIILIFRIVSTLYIAYNWLYNLK